MYEIEIGALKLQFERECTTVIWDHLKEPVVCVYAGISAIRKLDEMAFSAAKTEIEYQLCRRANEKFTEHFRLNWSATNELADNLLKYELLKTDNRTKRLEDALRRAWDWRARDKQIPVELQAEVDALLMDVPDRRT